VARVAAISCKALGQISARHAGNRPVHAATTELQPATSPFCRQPNAEIDRLALGIDRQDLPVDHAITTVGVIHPARRAEIHRADRLADGGHRDGSTDLLGGHIRRSDDLVRDGGQPGAGHWNSLRCAQQAGRQESGHQSARGEHGSALAQERTLFGKRQSGDFHDSALRLWLRCVNWCPGNCKDPQRTHHFNFV
jgi:hypothetical protein